MAHDIQAFLNAKDLNKKIGLMIAGNSGRPGGACGGEEKLSCNIHPHNTQEEDLMCAWVTSIKMTSIFQK